MQKEKIDSNPLLKHSFAFSLSLIAYCELLETRKKFVIAHQLLKSGTLIGGNAMEAQNAESKADFIHKIKIAAKEAEETQYWLHLCSYAENYPDCTELQVKIEELHKILGKILSTSKKKNLLGSCPVSLCDLTFADLHIFTFSH